jgi:hypothetical protein
MRPFGLGARGGEGGGVSELNFGDDIGQAGRVRRPDHARR